MIFACLRLEITNFAFAASGGERSTAGPVSAEAEREMLHRNNTENNCFIMQK
ncbi:hypothetical protein [Morganella morganii IS15]|nr:hypothetical protein C790_00791 [Morganella morganii SC01]CDK64186.1 hypothetical protein [Morganella morganii IS15]